MSHAESAATYAEARQQVEQRWRTAFENSAIGIAMADFAGRFFGANNIFRNMLGYTESEMYQLTGVAARLGLKRTTLISKMKKLRISRPVRQLEVTGLNQNPEPAAD